MDLVVLGSGTFSPDGQTGNEVRRPAGYAIQIEDQVLLFDLGFGDLHQMFRAGLDPAAVTHAFFTHRHPDHVGDLPALLFYYHYDAKPRSGRLRLYGPRGFSSFFSRLEKAYYPWLKPHGYEREVRELEEKDVVRGQSWKVLCREVPHSTQALAFRLESKSGSFCYSGDTGFDPGLAKFARGVDLFVLECSLPDGHRYEHHLQVSQALQIFKASGAKQGLMSHLSRESFKELNHKLSSCGNVRAASDLMRIQIG